MIPAGTDRRYTHFDKMAERYKVDRTTAHRWSEEEGFPEVLHTAGQGGMEIYDEDAVDAWVRENHFGSWVRQDKKLSLDLPAGGPRDLLTLSRIGELEGRVLRREPTPVKTLRTYISRGTLPKADRTPEDGQRPHVTEPMWFRETAYAYICRPRRVKRSTGEAQVKNQEAARVSEEQLLDLELPAGEDTDLLTLQQIGEVDGHARGWGKSTAASTLKKLLSQGALPKPDRQPGDGGDPAVEEPMWFRSTAYRFIRRPGRLGARARAGTAAEGPKAREAEGQLRNDLKLPAGEDTDLLTLQQIGVLDGKARGRGKATTVSTMRTYLSNGLLDKPDRTPGDGMEPPVDEPMWFRSTAYRFIRRPGRLGGARR